MARGHDHRPGGNAVRVANRVTSIGDRRGSRCRTAYRSPSGWIVLDKPYDLGSTSAVSRVRRAFNAQKAGHAGTLDPLATGILLGAGLALSG